MASDTSLFRKRAPGFYAIIAFKLGKGLLLVLLAFGVYKLSDDNLPDAFRQALKVLHLDPEKKFFTDLAEKIQTISETKMVVFAGGAFLYSLFSLVEGVGLIFRVPWAGWLAIGESVFFIPIEIFELLHHFTAAVTIILILNILIVWYLFKNRRRLFRHHHESPSQ
jgi:uncharacterized membrane protein (DUF2068 family)